MKGLRTLDILWWAKIAVRKVSDRGALVVRYAFG